MSQCANLLAIDLGAESGRGILGQFDGNRLNLEVLHRFPNGPVKLGERLYWDALRLFSEMKTALGLALHQGSLAGVGVDTWGVDFALLTAEDELLGNPRHYRDPHTENTMSEAFAIIPASEIFAETGIQFMRFNSLFQLLALKQARSVPLACARKLLFMPDLFHAWLCGETVNEATIASTSQCINPHEQTWAGKLLKRFGLSDSLLGRIVPAGTRLGKLLPGIVQELGIGAGTPVIAPASHDTAAAVAAVPAQGDQWAYISSGTWSLMGVELPAPVINEDVRAANFTNEGGVGGTTRFLKNIMGLWLVQECKRSFARQGQDYPYEQLVKLAKESKPFQCIINPDDSRFLLPADMPEAIRKYCEETGQPSPATPGALVRCCLESLALRYRWTMEKLSALTGRAIHVLHIVGGGCQNHLLNQLTADATGCVTWAGPVEATALGNLLTQAMGLGLVGTLSQARQVVRASFQNDRFEPRDTQDWQAPYARFLQLI